jgi:pilus assembly protein CpaB
MRARFFLLLAINVILVLGVLFASRAWLSGSDDEPEVVREEVPPPPEMVEVLTAKGDLPVGSLLDKSDLSWRPWPKENLSDKFISKPKDQPPEESTELENGVIGGVVRYQIAAGQPIVDGLLVKPGERGFLAAILSPDHRAVSISINASSGGAGLIMPGDRVDVLLTQNIQVKSADGEEEERRASETLLADVRVLAIDQKVSGDPEDPQVGRTATIEVSPRQAETLALGEEMGRLSLALRSIQSTANDRQGRGSAIWDYNASMAMGAGAMQAAAPEIVRGDSGQDDRKKN